MSTPGRTGVGRDLTQGPVFKTLVTFVGPIILTNLIQQLYSMTDLIIVGKFVGSTGTVGVSTGGEIVDMLTPIASAFATAGQIYIAQLAGAKQEDKKKDAIGSFFTLMIVMSLGFTLLSMLLCNPVLRLLNCPEDAFSQARSYMLITSMGLPFIFGYNAACGILRGMGESKRPLMFIIIAAVTNVVLDLLLVALIPMEAAGSAIATVIAQFGSFGAAMIYIYRSKEQFGLDTKLSSFKMRWEHVKVIFAFGIPQAARSMLVRVSMLWVNSSINSYGLTVSATNGVGNKLLKFVEIYATSFSQGSAAIIGQNLGAREHDRVKKTILYTCGICLGFAAVVSAIVLIWPKAVFGLFTSDAAVLDMGVIYLYIMIAHFFSSAIITPFQALVIGSGNSGLNFVIGILDGVVCKVGLSILFAIVMEMGAFGFFWGTSLSRVLPCLICIVYYAAGKWKTRKLLGESVRRVTKVSKDAT